MRGNELLDKMELIDSAYVEAADAMPKRRRAAWLRWCAAAACLSLLAIAGIELPRKDDSVRVSIGGIPREYKNMDITAGESAMEWPWEYKTVSEQYTTLAMDGEEFLSRGPVAASRVGDALGRYDVGEIGRAHV